MRCTLCDHVLFLQMDALLTGALRRGSDLEPQQQQSGNQQSRSRAHTGSFTHALTQTRPAAALVPHAKAVPSISRYGMKTNATAPAILEADSPVANALTPRTAAAKIQGRFRRSRQSRPPTADSPSSSTSSPLLSTTLTREKENGVVEGLTTPGRPYGYGGISKSVSFHRTPIAVTLEEDSLRTPSDLNEDSYGGGAGGSGGGYISSPSVSNSSINSPVLRQISNRSERSTSASYLSPKQRQEQEYKGRNGNMRPNLSLWGEGDSARGGLEMEEELADMSLTGLTGAIDRTAVEVSQRAMVAAGQKTMAAMSSASSVSPFVLEALDAAKGNDIKYKQVSHGTESVVRGGAIERYWTVSNLLALRIQK